MENTLVITLPKYFIYSSPCDLAIDHHHCPLTKEEPEAQGIQLIGPRSQPVSDGGDTQILVLEHLTTGPSCHYLTSRELTSRGSLRAEQGGEDTPRSSSPWTQGPSPQKRRDRPAQPFGG